MIANAPSELSALPAPGLYRDVPFADYAAWKAVSQSILRCGADTSWRRAKALFDGELQSEDSQAKEEGRAIHQWILERESFESAWEVAQPCQGVLRSGERSGSCCGLMGSVVAQDGGWRCRKHATPDCREPQSVLAASMVERLRGIAAAVADCHYAKLFLQPGGAEVSVSAEINGLPCKARIDRYTPASSGRPAVIWDLKTIPSGEGHEAKLVRRVRDYGMDVQAAWYSNLVHRITGERPAYAWIFVEKSAPYEVIVWKAGLDMMELGQAKLAKYWGDWERCCFENFWPGYQGRQTDRVPELPPDFRELQAWGIEGK